MAVLVDRGQVARVIDLLLRPAAALGVCLAHDVMHLGGDGHSDLAALAVVALTQAVIAPQNLETQFVPL